MTERHRGRLEVIVLTQLVYPPPVRTTGTALLVGTVESEEEGVWWLTLNALFVN